MLKIIKPPRLKRDFSLQARRLNFFERAVLQKQISIV
jgi:hypothetical protein